MNHTKGHNTDDKMKVEVIEYINELGRSIFYERYENIIAVSDFDHGSKYKHLCEGCPQHGKNLSCPPFSPTFSQFTGEAASAKVICLRLPMDFFNHSITEERYRACFRKARSMLVDELLEFRDKDFIVAGSGACLACKQCTIEKGNELCSKPEKRIYSLESLGVNVVTLSKTCFDLDFEWSANEQAADFVCSVGAVFFNEGMKI